MNGKEIKGRKVFVVKLHFINYLIKNDRIMKQVIQKLDTELKCPKKAILNIMQSIVI